MLGTYLDTKIKVPGNRSTHPNEEYFHTNFMPNHQGASIDLSISAYLLKLVRNPAVRDRQT